MFCFIFLCNFCSDNKTTNKQELLEFNLKLKKIRKFTYKHSFISFYSNFEDSKILSSCDFVFYFLWKF